MIRTALSLVGAAPLIPAHALAQSVPTSADPIAYAKSAGIPEIPRDAAILNAEGNVLLASVHR